MSTAKKSRKHITCWQQSSKFALLRTTKNDKDSPKQADSLQIPLSWSFRACVFVIWVFFVKVCRHLRLFECAEQKRGVRYLVTRLEQLSGLFRRLQGKRFMTSRASDSSYYENGFQRAEISFVVDGQGTYFPKDVKTQTVLPHCYSA